MKKFTNDSFCEITSSQLVSASEMIGKDWMLITVSDPSKPSGANSMTASWGFLGYIWNKNTATVFIRPERHTFELVEASERFSIAFFGSKRRDEMKLCGTRSGRDCDKIAECGFSVSEYGGVPVIEDAELFMICKKLYFDDLKKENFLDKDMIKYYERDGYHRAYVLEIENIYARVDGEYFKKA